MTRTKDRAIIVVLAAFVAVSATMPSIAASPASGAAALRAAVSDGITQVQRNCYGCLGGRDNDGIPCRC
jgi:hypothetical protein